jgi:hypothetical protein
MEDGRDPIAPTFMTVPAHEEDAPWPDRLGAAIDVTHVIPVLVEAGQHEGVQVGVPMLWFPTLFYWNKDTFRAHGLDPDHPPSAWDELEAAARATTATDHESGARQWGFPLPTYGSLPAWAMLMWQNGGGVLSEDGQAVLLDAPESVDVTSADPHVAVFLESAAHSRVHLPGIAQRDVITEDILLATIRRILAGEVGAEEGLGEAADNLRALLGIG